MIDPRGRLLHHERPFIREGNYLVYLFIKIRIWGLGIAVQYIFRKVYFGQISQLYYSRLRHLP